MKTVETSLGIITIQPTGIRSAIVKFDELTVNRVKYKGNIRFCDYGQGFELCRERPENPNSIYYAIFAYRVGDPNNDAKVAARRKMTDIITEAVRYYALRNKAAFEAVGREQHEAAITVQREKINNARAELAKLESELAALLAV